MMAVDCKLDSLVAWDNIALTGTTLAIGTYDTSGSKIEQDESCCVLCRETAECTFWVRDLDSDLVALKKDYSGEQISNVANSRSGMNHHGCFKTRNQITCDVQYDVQKTSPHTTNPDLDTALAVQGLNSA